MMLLLWLPVTSQACFALLHNLPEKWATLDCHSDSKSDPLNFVEILGGIGVLGTAGATDAKLMHAANVLANALDPRDGGRRLQHVLVGEHHSAPRSRLE